MSLPKRDLQRGVIPLFLLLAGVGLIVFIFISSSAPFKDKFLNLIFPKATPSAEAIAPKHEQTVTGG